MLQSNLNNEFYNLFFEGRGKDWVILKSKKIICAEIGVIDFNRLKESVFSLPPATKFYI